MIGFIRPALFFRPSQRRKPARMTAHEVLFLRFGPCNRLPHGGVGHHVLHLVVIHDAQVTVAERLGHGQRHFRLGQNHLGARLLRLGLVLLLERHGRQAVATLRGADDAYSRVLPLDSLMTAGDARLRIGELERLLIGQTMAYTLGIRTLADAEVTLYALRRSSFSTLLPLDSYTRRRVETGGVYALDLDTERRYVLSSLRLARELFNYPDRASALLLRTSPGADPAEVAARVARIAGDDFRIRTRAEMQASLYRIMRYEKWGIFFISLLVLVIASFSIVGALAMLIVEKRDDAATLRALGADTSFLRRLFRQEGLLISASGAVLGLVLGLGATLLQQHYGLIRIPAESFLMQSYPVEFRWGDLLAVAAAFAVTAGTITWVTVRSMIKRTEP